MIDIFAGYVPYGLLRKYVIERVGVTHRTLRLHERRATYPAVAVVDGPVGVVNGWITDADAEAVLTYWRHVKQFGRGSGVAARAKAAEVKAVEDDDIKAVIERLERAVAELRS